MVAFYHQQSKRLRVWTINTFDANFCRTCTSYAKLFSCTIRQVKYTVTMERAAIVHFNHNALTIVFICYTDIVATLVRGLL